MVFFCIEACLLEIKNVKLDRLGQIGDFSTATRSKTAMQQVDGFFGVFYGFEFKFGKDSILLCECNRFYNAFIVIKTLCPKRSYPKVVEVGMHVGQPRRSTGFSSSRAVGAAQHLLGIIGHDFLSQNFL